MVTLDSLALVERSDSAVLPQGGGPAVDSAIWEVQALMLEAIARDAVGDMHGAEEALERALGLAEPDGLLFPFLFDPAPALLDRHPRVLAAHGSLVAKIRHLLARREVVSRPAGLEDPPEELSDAESKVLRYLSTHLTAAEIAGELCVSANTVKTHMRHLYAKLGVHRRSEAVERARAFGLLAPPARRRQLGAAVNAAPPASASFASVVAMRALSTR
jgi:LuxR family transcriptional regulator, maltose regulon positive regulatory protein